MRTLSGSARRSALFLYAFLTLFALLLSACEPESSARAGAALVASAEPVLAEPRVTSSSPEAAGRYLVEIGGCNDCHTEGFIMDPGLAESEWLKGSVVGFRGPWGTSYPRNLRLTATNLTEDEWVARLRGQGLPPMPWAAVNRLSEADSRAMYRYVRSLGEAGAPAPVALPPEVEPTTPWFDFVPHTPAASVGR